MEITKEEYLAVQAELSDVKHKLQVLKDEQVVDAFQNKLGESMSEWVPKFLLSSAWMHGNIINAAVATRPSGYDHQEWFDLIVAKWLRFEYAIESLPPIVYTNSRVTQRMEDATEAHRKGAITSEDFMRKLVEFMVEAEGVNFDTAKIIPTLHYLRSR